MPDQRPLTVLAVDDTPAVLALYARLTETRPAWTLITADNGQTGIDAARETRPDLILLDRSMPVMDGLAALVDLRADPDLADTPVAMVSAEPEVEPYALGAGATWFIDKASAPREVAALLDRIQAGEGA